MLWESNLSTMWKDGGWNRNCEHNCDIEMCGGSQNCQHNKVKSKFKECNICNHI